MRKLTIALIIISILLGIFFLAGPLYIIKEGEQAVVIRFGQVVEVVTAAGLKFKAPFIDNVVRYSKKILSWDGDPRRIPTSENQFIWVDSIARWKIQDPLRFYSAITTMEQAYSRLDDIIESATRTTIARNSLSEAVRNSNSINNIDRKLSGLSLGETSSEKANRLKDIQTMLAIVEPQPEIKKGRRLLSQEMLASARQVTPEFGIELIDIIIRQIRYSDDLTESVYTRMISERKRIAQAYRAYGDGRKKELFGKLENEKRTILSRAYESAESIRGRADAEASHIYASAYNKNINFFEFWRAIKSYQSVLPKFNKTLTTDIDYFRFLYDKTGR